MQKILAAVVAVCVLIVAWQTLSTLPAQGFRHATLETQEGNVAFDYHILAARSGMNAWVSVNGAPERSMDALDMQRRHIRFDLPADGKVYHLNGIVGQRKLDGTWRLDDGDTGTWHARRCSVKKG